jgi:argininosuccinate lyase
MRLWDKGGDLDAIIAAFTVGEDPVLDLAWAWQDVVGSAAHVRVQVAAGMITGAGRCLERP